MSTESWPQALKDWVAKCLGQMTDANRLEAQTELRQVISDSFSSKTLWTTDWAGVELNSLKPKPPPVISAYTLKRKSTDAAPPAKKAKKSALAKGSTSQALDPNDLAALNRRAARFHREHDIERQKLARPHHHNGLNNQVAHNFSARFDSLTIDNDDPEANPNVPSWDKYTIVGTSTEVFKDYLRLTSEPNPEQIRPYHILQQTLEQLKTRWKQKTSYNWICSQFKSLRQDLTVQRIKNEFTVNVYEIHARIALEVGDMVEYNQCQGALRNLYELGIPGHQEEFTAYRILMLLHGRNKSDLNLYVGQLTLQQKSDNAVQHALNVQRALALGNYHALFKLYENAPNMGAYLMDQFVGRERARSLMIMSKAYMTLPLSFIHTELAFEKIEDTREFIMQHGAGIWQNPLSLDNAKILDCKAARDPLSRAFEEKYRKVTIKGAV